MKRRFVIAVDKPTSEQTRAISDIFRDRYGWWHWIEGFWLVADPTGKLTAAWIRDRIGEVAPGCRNLVIQVSHESWAGSGPSAPENTMFDWIRKNWE